MSLRVRDILERRLLEGAQIVAGERGIGNEVQWVNFMEILDALDSLQEGELLITTGFQIDDEERYHDLIFSLKKRGVCGAAIQTGYYIDRIPAYILKDADLLGFPLIELPARLTFSHIMHVLLENIGMKGQGKRDAELTDLKRCAVKMAQPFPAEESRVFLVTASASLSSNVLPERTHLQDELEKLRAYFTGRSGRVEMKARGNRAVYLFSLHPEFQAEDIVIDLIQIITRVSREDRVNVWAGISDLSRNPHGAEAAFENALEAEGMLRRIGAKKGVCYYADLRFFEWFEHLQKRDDSLAFAYDTLKPVIAYDSFHNGEYLQTLRVYLANDCKVSETAKKLFIHRHTLTSRIERIAKLCSVDFEDYFVRMHLCLALTVYDFFLS